MVIFTSLKKACLISFLILISPVGISAEPEIQGNAAKEYVTPSTAQKKKPGYHAAGFRIKPSLSITSTFNDNIFATDTKTETDFITVISPRLNLDSTWDKHSIQFRFGADIGRYAEYDTENYNDYWITMNGRYDFNPSTDIFGGLGFASEHEGRGSPDAVFGGLSPTTYQSKNGHIGINTTLGKTTYRTVATYENLDFDNVWTRGGYTIINNDRDRELFGFGIRATHKLNKTYKLFAQALYDARKYDQAIDENGYARDSDGYRVAGGFKNDDGSGNKAEAYIGLIGQDYDDSRFDSIREIDFGGSFTFRPTGKTRITGELQRTLNETTLADSSGYLNTSLSTKLEHRLSQNLFPHVKLGYAELDYQDHGRKDDIISAEAGLKYYLARNTYLTAGYRHVNQDSNDFGLINISNDYKDNSVFLTLTSHGYPVFEPDISDFTTQGEFEIGALYLSEDSSRFGKYTGLDSAGTHLNGGFLVESNNSDNSWATIESRNLGLDSRSLDIEWGDRGDYSVYLNYDELPSTLFNGNTLFEGGGSTTLTLPAGWTQGDETSDLTDLSRSLKEVQIGTKRKKLGVGASFLRNKYWTLSLGFETDTKEGYQQMAGVIGHAPGDIRSAMLPAPVDYTTNKLKASMGYAKEQTQISLEYQGSFFMNHLKALNWENPFDDAGPRGNNGSISLAPDNQFHQISLSGGHTLFGTTRFTGVASYAAMYQDDSFLPDSVDAYLTPHALPRSSLDGEVYQTNALLALSSRPLSGLNMKASYRFQKRDNQTPIATYTYHVNDSKSGTSSSTPATDTNDPYSYERGTTDLSAGYRLNRNARLNGNITHETYECSPCEVSKTTEDGANLRLRLTPTNDLQFTIRGGVSSRDGSAYQTIVGENPLLRKYNISDRDRQLAGLNISYQPVERLAIGANLDFSENDYDATLIGLTSSKQSSITLDASYQLSDTLSGYTNIGREIIESEQSGSQDEADDNADWFIDNDDTIDSLGLGIKWQQSHKLEITADYTFSGGKGEANMTSLSANPPVSQFPDLKTNLHSLKLIADYKLRKNTSVKLSYLYERYDADDWSIDGVNSNTIPEVLLLDEANPGYKEHMIGISLITRF